MHAVTSYSQSGASCGRPNIFRYMVVDCGGGTIDITIHDLNMGTKKIAEVYQANGGGWGGTNVDDEIEQLVRDVVGARLMSKASNRDLYELKRIHIEEMKHKVREDVATVSMGLPFSLAQAINENGGRLEGRKIPGLAYRKRHHLPLQFNTSTLQDCFKKSLSEITSHLHKKMNAHQGIRCLMLVGGYAESPILFNRMKREFETRTCKVIRPEHASLPVVKGAVMFGQYPDTIETRCSRYTYGTDVVQVFNPSVHPVERKVVVNGEEYCREVFKVLVRVGEPVTMGQRKSLSFPPLRANQELMGFPLFRTEKESPQFVDEGIKLDSMSVEMPNVEKGLDRSVVFEWNFSRTEIHCTAYNKDTPAVRKEMKIGFEHVRTKPTA